MPLTFRQQRGAPATTIALLEAALLQAWRMFCSVMLCYVMLCSALCGVLRDSFGPVLCRSILFCSLFCSVLSCSVLFCSVRFSVVCSVLFCSLLFCYVPLGRTLIDPFGRCSRSRRMAFILFCSVLCSVLFCSVLFGAVLFDVLFLSLGRMLIYLVSSAAPDCARALPPPRARRAPPRRAAALRDGYSS